jgi:purine-binding chemotaxis protein CheW
MSEFKNENDMSGSEELSGNQYLTFQLAEEMYGVDILKVEEIRGWEPVREIPNSPGFIKGVLNLRGFVVPIIDLRDRFGMEQVDYHAKTVVIVLSVESDDESHVMGIIADAVSEVLEVDEDKIKKAPNLGVAVDTQYIKGMVMGEKMVMLLDTDKLLNPEEFSLIEGVG